MVNGFHLLLSMCRWLLRQKLAAAGILLACWSGPALAQVCSGIPGLTVNSSFEAPDVTTTPPAPAQTFGSNPFARLYNEGDVPGWSTTAPDNRIELWQSGFNSVTSQDGNQHAEVNASAIGALFQDIATSPGSEVIWSFAHRGRSGVDTIRVEMGSPGGTLSNQGNFSTGTSAWDVKTGTYLVPAGQTVTRFQFRAISTAAGNATVGNFIDDVRISPLCDYGDAANSFPVIRVNNGAAHRIQSGVFLGSGVDADFDGQPSASALGDDNDGNDDEDGVSFGLGAGGTIIRRANNPLNITASAAGYVNVWVDFNQDGVWSAAENIIADSAVIAGTQTLFFTLPSTAQLGNGAARVRYSADNPLGAMGPGGDWGSGEVEDLLITTVDQAVLSIAKSSAPFIDAGDGIAAGEGFNVPQQDVLYSVTVTNIGEGVVEDGSVFVYDELPAQGLFFNGDANGTAAGTGAALFVDNGSSLTFSSASDLGFSDSPTAPGNFSDCDYVPAPGYDPAVRYVCFNPKGIFQSGGSSPSFQVQFRIQIQ